MKISQGFDSGSIEVVSASRADDIRVQLRRDNAAEFRQWFHFRVHDAAGVPLRMVFENAADAAYPDGWPDYRAVASYDRRHWFRVSGTTYENGQLVITHTPERNNIYYAYFEPYSHERHLDLLGRTELSPFAQVASLGSTVDGREVDVITVGRARPERAPVWIIARQHPGETMAEWFVEGLLERLLDGADPVARRIREKACLYVVPNMNPDGGVRGNLRTNAAGVNLNRAWAKPSAQTSPEVFHVRAHMEATGCALFLDIHGDESLPYVFIDGAGMVPGFPAPARRQEDAFLDALATASPDFQRQHGYAPDRFGEEMLTLASKWVAHRFGCVSLTLEMPFKDNALMPDGQSGWSGARSKRLGAAMLQPILAHLDGR
ncbi:carboxypeptidase family protein [Nitrogeniibacter mangrovi]|uniref:Carboxypeptidase family protein n=1 Tax=Nitrogeniibacter mangrovi TaxID=2016596 RepID=A0A6C1B7X0_9RHOO|nr:carboxypeptidase family protein [Nitrogeniibacter mangrovi]QID19801.1 carboxypeptidase family protein [Nitrogeniibacter mangrovi]